MLRYTPFLLVLLGVLPMSGCGKDATPTLSTNRDEMQAYIDEHPELNISLEDLDAQPEPGMGKSE